MPELPIFDELNHPMTAQAPTPEIIKVAIIEDQRDIREGLATMFKFTGGYRSTGCYRSMEEALEKISGDVLKHIVVVGVPPLADDVLAIKDVMRGSRALY